MKTPLLLTGTGALLLSAALLFPALAQTDTTAPPAAPVSTPSVPVSVPTSTVPQATPSVPTQSPATPTAQPPVAQPPATQPPTAQTWTHDSLQAATYLMLPAEIHGNTAILTGDQQTGVLTALNHDSRAAIARKYPAAQFTTDPATPNVVTVRPVAVMPAAFLPWATVQASLELTDPLGNRATVQGSFNLLTVYRQRTDAANYVFDMIAAKLP